jgi:LPS sulfotransferase NodH
MPNNKFPDHKNYVLFHLSLFLYKTGLTGGQKKYRRFIILTTARSGSNFLLGMLNSHTQVLAFGELFREKKNIGWDLDPYDRYLQSDRLKKLAQRDPVAFIENKVFRNFPAVKKAVGFKIFYYHAQDESMRHLWRFLRDQNDINVIHLKRMNTLKTMLSLKKAFLTNKWTQTSIEKEERSSISLDYEECLENFNWTQQTQKKYDKFFQNHPKLDITYEDLSNNVDREMERIQKFLGIDYEICTPATIKQSNQTLSQAISNYPELKARFKNTPWEPFFED